MPRIVIPYTAITPFLVTAFLVVANFASLPQPVRLGVMVGIIGVLGLTIFSHIKISFQPRVVAYVTLVIVLVALTLFHSRQYASLTEFADNKRLYFYFAFVGCGLIIPLAVRKRVNLEPFAWLLVAFSVLFALLAFTSGSTGSARASGIGLNPALHSKLVLFPALLFIAYAGSQIKDRKLLIFALIGIAGCLATGSRGSIVILVLTFLVDRMKEASLKETLKAIGVLLGGLVVLMALLELFPAEITERFTFSSLADQSDEGDRLFLYNLGLELFFQAQAGIGMGNFSAYFWIAAPHNVVLEALVELGVAIGGLFILLLVMTGFRAMRHLRSTDPITRFYGLFFIFMIGNSMIGGEMSFPSFMLYMSMGIVWLSDLRDTEPLASYELET